MSDSLRLSDVLGRGVSIEWFEAVALSADVAERVRDTLGGQSVPELHQVQIGADGRVSLSGASRTEEPVRRLGQLLQATLGQADPPVQLRLMVSQATAPNPTFPSVREFLEALAYFERPDRETVLRGLHDRAASAPAVDVMLTPTLDAIAPLQQAEAKKPERPAQAATIQKRRAIPAVAAAVILIVGGVAYWQFATAATNERVSTIAVKASDAVGTALVSGISAVSDRVGLGRLAPADGSGSVPPAKPAAAPPAPKLSVVRKPSDARAPTQPFKIYDLTPEAAAGAPTPALVEALPPEPPVAAVAPPPTEPDGTIYTTSDPEVTAPIGVRPQLPAVLPSQVRKEQLGQIELLILPDGTVGAVKLIGRPRSVLEGMLLSAAKAWTFRPALKNGQPVAYRKLVWLVLQ